MISNEIDGLTAWESLLASANTRWEANIRRFDQSPVEIVHRPKFSIEKSDRFFCLGSCFARNIEEHLIYCGIEVLSKQIISPQDERETRPNAFVNKFTAGSIAYETSELLADKPITEDQFEQRSNGWYDLHLAPGLRPVELERAIDRRRYLRTEYFSRLRATDVVVITLGFIEVWEDRKTQGFLNAVPDFFSVKREPGRYVLHVQTVEDTLADLDRVWRDLNTLNPAIRMILTVSPVPMQQTFSGRDILVANTASKAVLRVAAEMFAGQQDRVDYFPSFDMVASAPRTSAYTADCVHVADKTVAAIIKSFVLEYLNFCPHFSDFNETAYLRANEDVHSAVRRGDFVSGFQHWTMYGRAENRPLLPKTPESLLLALGV